MATTVSAVKHAAFSLSVAEQEALAEQLMLNVAQSATPEMRQAHIDEVMRRRHEILSGKQKTISKAQLTSDIEELLA